MLTVSRWSALMAGALATSASLAAAQAQPSAGVSADAASADPAAQTPTVAQPRSAASAPSPAPADTYDTADTQAPQQAQDEAPAAAEPSWAADDVESSDAADAWGKWADDKSLPQEDEPIFEGRIYGFIDAYLEKVANTPTRDPDDPDRTLYESNPYEFEVLNLHVMVQGSIYGRYRFFINLAAPGSGSNAQDAPISVRNAWVEAPLIPDYLSVRAGKTYRRFGLYNEILDAVPTFIGIEPPEMFDKDHLLLTRTTNLMLFGSAELDDAVLHYSLATGNDERKKHAVPIGLDAYVDLWSTLRIGTSFYWTGGDAVPTKAVQEGSPKGGVINWMESDRFLVFGGYAQLTQGGLIAQAEYWQAEHDGVRDLAALSILAEDGSLNSGQLNRFFVGGDPDAGGIRAAKYTVRTAYLRLGYSIPLGDTASLTPYAQLDYYDNPETIAEKSLGGDNEAGLGDEGDFQKYTLGLVYRPITQVALKVDGSGHLQDFNGRAEFYPELRLSFSYLWGLQ